MIRAVLFDLDGTTVDTNELIIETLQHVLRDHCSMEVTREEIIPQMGGPLSDQFCYFTGQTEVDELVAAYREYNRKRHDEMVQLFPGVLEVVQQLYAKELQLGIVTTKVRMTTERALRMFGLYPYMKTIVTFDDVRHPKPHPEPVEKAMAALRVRPEETLMVGDSPADIGSANAAGAISVGVAWSLKGEQVLRDSGARHIIHAMTELYDLCEITRDEA